MATLATTRDKLQAAIATISGLYVFDVWPNSINQYPAVVVMPSAMPPRISMGAGKRQMIFELILIGGSAERDPKRAQDTLDAYCDETGDNSIIAALQADLDLDGTVSTLDVSWRDYGDELELGGVKHLTVTFEIVVWQ